MDVSVVICAHDEARWGDLEAALYSLEQQRNRPAEVVLVIDHSPLLLQRARAQLRGALVVENSEPRGLGGARNSGIAASSGSAVAFLDDDAVASPQWLSVLVEQYSDPEVAGVGGRVEPVWEGARPPWFPVEFDWVVGCTYRGMPETAQEVRNLFGCNMSFRREVLEALGRFRLGYGCDETELCIRLRQRWPWRKVVYVPEGKVFHLVSADRARLQYFLSRCYFEGGSKAVVSALVGTQTGLASERRYTRETLPEGIRQGVGDFIHGGDRDGLARAAAILAGLTTTTVGYITGRVATSGAARRRGWCGGVLPESSAAWETRPAPVTR
jgi:glycosyltransferase involved in cell wall biosynthesis